LAIVVLKPLRSAYANRFATADAGAKLATR
jgi:hypothetical protein